jgi:DNA-nicking Smr family endonuclease
MNIGDKVRLLHSKEQGVITKFLSNNRVEVEIEDGFQIPLKINEIALVSHEETQRFGKEEKDIILSKTMPAQSHKGIFAGFLPLNQERYALYLINNTDLDLPFVANEENDGQTQGIACNILKARQNIKIKELNFSEMNQWGIFSFQFLYFSYQKMNIKNPFVHKIRFRSNTFLNHKGTLPILQKEGFVFQLDKDLVEESEQNNENLISKIDAQKIKEEMLKPKTTDFVPLSRIIKRPSKEVDLHIEILTDKYNQMNSAEMLAIQLEVFEKNLENAIATAMHEIIFIHGVGNGTLRQEIHKRLSKNKNIKFYQDAKKEKFGYGATLVAFK